MGTETKEPTGREQARRARQSAADKGFDADAYARERAEDTITVDGAVFHRRLLNNQVSEEAQDIGVEQDRILRRAEGKERQLRSLTGYTDMVDGKPVEVKGTDPDAFEQIEELEDEIRGLTREATGKTYELAAFLLQDGEGKPPDIATLKEKVHVGALRELVRMGEEPLLGPTPASES